MKKTSQTTFCLTIFACLFLTGCGSSSIALNPNQPMTLYSIDGRESQFEPPESAEKFHGFLVLGKTEITNGDQQAQVVNAIQRSVDQSDGTMAKCFWPRHGIRQTVDGEQVDYVICFQCLQMKVETSVATEMVPITEDAKEELSEILRDAGIPIAPGG